MTALINNNDDPIGITVYGDIDRGQVDFYGSLGHTFADILAHDYGEYDVGYVDEPELLSPSERNIEVIAFADNNDKAYLRPSFHENTTLDQLPAVLDRIKQHYNLDPQ